MSLAKTLERHHGATPAARAERPLLRASAQPCRVDANRSRASLCTLAVMSVLSMAPAAHAQVTETVLYSFTGGSDGAIPGYLRADTTGPGGAARALYGTANAGGDQNANCPQVNYYPGCGTVFKLTAPKPGEAAWNETTLWLFSGGKDQYAPYGALAAGTNRIDGATSLYGTTQGAPEGGGDDGGVFSLTGASLKTIWKVHGRGNYSADFFGPVAIDSSGAVYATAGDPHGRSCGSVEKLTPPDGSHAGWTRTLLWDFVYSRMNYREIGCTPMGVRIDESGALYGVLTYRGPINPPCNGPCGGVFKLTPPAQGQTAWTEQTISKFPPGPDGSQVISPPFIAKDGKLYGTIVFGSLGCGTVYELTPPHGGSAKWREHDLWDFAADGTDGCGPIDAPIVDKTGAVYGTTSLGAAGIVYKLTPPAEGQTAWTETNLYTFSNGLSPQGSLVADQTGTLYGAIYNGGADGKGFVFSLTGTGFVPN